MRYLLWAVGIVSIVAFISVVADGSEPDAARVAPRETYRIPQSNQDPIPNTVNTGLNLPAELEGSSIEVGFSQDGEPEPHLLAVAEGGKVKLFELGEQSSAADSRKVSSPTTPPGSVAPKSMPLEVYVKRMHQIVDADRFFSAKQPRPKARCKDKYVLRIQRGDKFKERRGCSNQSNDAFAAFAQNIFRDAFLVWTRAK